ncbi:fumarylacetoacetate hydrolase family protein [Micromonospora radicis]|uniref:Fumarylacetoacetate hydrolase family protein n=1 Tax=Micromonospora radicis TaxID=1894971 RepID=A0A418MY50_9ACTN|nr:fumarylacetoacetate hydrolase family protein [Micromonospora radicis]RIV40029.1 fumarylacetoacetate hydrolase family protein [Micromonospora radicis]
MRICNHDGRLILIPADHPVTDVPETAVDVERASGGRFGSDPQGVFSDWAAFRAWCEESTAEPDVKIDVEKLGPPVPAPRQIFAIGLNYLAHAVESRMEGAAVPPTFTKFVSCLTGPYASVTLPSANVDFEVELVVAISRTAHKVAAEDAWDHVAGLMVGQDLSERKVQLQPPVPQFSLGKSYPGFGPTGPWLITPEEVGRTEDVNNLRISSAIDGVTMQDDTTAQMILNVADLIAHLSSICTLMPGDLIFTGTPSGVGQAREPQRFLRPGEVLVSTIAGVGQLRTSLVAAEI